METKDTFLEKPRQELEKKNNEFHLSSCSMIKRPKNTYKTETEDQHSFCFKKSKKKKKKKKGFTMSHRGIKSFCSVILSRSLSLITKLIRHF